MANIAKLIERIETLHTALDRARAANRGNLRSSRELTIEAKIAEATRALMGADKGDLAAQPTEALRALLKCSAGLTLAEIQAIGAELRARRSK